MNDVQLFMLFRFFSAVNHLKLICIFLIVNFFLQFWVSIFNIFNFKLLFFFFYMSVIRLELFCVFHLSIIFSILNYIFSISFYPSGAKSGEVARMWSRPAAATWRSAIASEGRTFAPRDTKRTESSLAKSESRKWLWPMKVSFFYLSFVFVLVFVIQFCFSLPKFKWELCIF